MKTHIRLPEIWQELKEYLEVLALGLNIELLARIVQWI